MENPREEEIWYEAHRDEIKELSKNCRFCNRKEVGDTVLNPAESLIAEQINMNQNMLNHIEFDQLRFYNGLKNATPPLMMPGLPFKENDNSIIFLILGYLLGKFGSDKKDDGNDRCSL